MSIYWFPQEMHWLVPTMEAYYIQVGVLKLMTIIQLVVLLRKLWSFKNLEKSKKSEWTWALILFNLIASLIYIWKRLDQHEELNNKAILDNDQNST